MPSYSSYKRQMSVLDKDDDIVSWITVRGNHIPIRKGQSKEDAVKSFIEHQAGKNDLPQGTKWSPTNKSGEGTGNKKAPKKEKYVLGQSTKVQFGSAVFVRTTLWAKEGCEYDWSFPFSKKKGS